MFDDGKRKPVATQDFVDPRSGRRVRVSYNDVEATRELRERGFKREGGIREERCHSYQVEHREGMTMAETVNFTAEQMAVVQQMIEAQTQKALASVGINEPKKPKEPPKKPLDTTTIYRAKDGRAVIVNKADAGILLAEGDFTDKAPAAPKTGGK